MVNNLQVWVKVSIFNFLPIFDNAKVEISNRKNIDQNH